jgi:hypothetical protein
VPQRLRGRAALCILGGGSVRGVCSYDSAARRPFGAPGERTAHRILVRPHIALQDGIRSIQPPEEHRSVSGGTAFRSVANFLRRLCQPRPGIRSSFAEASSRCHQSRNKSRRIGFSGSVGDGNTHPSPIRAENRDWRAARVGGLTDWRIHLERHEFARRSIRQSPTRARLPSATFREGSGAGSLPA